MIRFFDFRPPKWPIILSPKVFRANQTRFLNSENGIIIRESELTVSPININQYTE